jgi:hypothetical protein
MKIFKSVNSTGEAKARKVGAADIKWMIYEGTICK